MGFSNPDKPTYLQVISDISQPLQLRLNVEKLVRWVLLLAAGVHRFEKAFVNIGIWRCDMFPGCKGGAPGVEVVFVVNVMEGRRRTISSTVAATQNCLARSKTRSV
jgi:hypothetical protein